MVRGKICPFGIEAKFCKYQRTYAKDLVVAAEMKLIFFCVLDAKEECLQLKRMLNETFKSLR